MLEPSKNIKKLEFGSKPKYTPSGLLGRDLFMHGHRYSPNRYIVSPPPPKKKTFFSKVGELISDFGSFVWESLYTRVPLTFLIFLTLFLTNIIIVIINGELEVNLTFLNVFIPFIMFFIEDLFND